MKDSTFDTQGNPEENLAEALDRSLTAKAPPVSDELKSLFGLASELQRLPLPDIDQDHFFSTLLRIGSALDRARRPPIFHRAWVRAAAGILLFLAVGLGSSLFSEKSNPGDLLYPVKLLTEKVRIAFTLNRADQVELRLTFAENRSHEFVRALEKTNTVDKQLLQSMLLEAAQALSQTTDLPQTQQPPLLDRARSLNRYQYGILGKAKSRVPGDSLVLDRALCTCWERMEYFHGARSPDAPAGQTTCPMDSCCR